jgi:hypothetical protein
MFLLVSRSITVIIWLLLNAIYLCNWRPDVHALSITMMNMAAAPQGSAAVPSSKKKIVVVGGGGYMGAMTFGYLQRAYSLYGTGIGNVRCIGATSDTAVRLNRVLSKHFSLAQADESCIKLTDLASVDAISNRLNGWDAIIFGANLFVQPRTVTANTYERTPNDKAYVGNAGTC